MNKLSLDRLDPMGLNGGTLLLAATERRDHRLGLRQRCRVALGLLMDLRRHDLRTRRAFMMRMYPGQPILSKWVRFLGWLWQQCLVAIPEGLRETSFDKAVSRTPYWLAHGNPLADYPWSRNPQSPFPDKAMVVVIGAGFTGASLAYHWAKSGVADPMVVLEMADPAAGASGRNAGEVLMGRYFAMVYSTVLKHLPCLRPDLPLDKLEGLARQFSTVYCRAAYKNADLIEETIREEHFACDYSRLGWVQERSASEQAALQESVRMGRANGFTDWDELSPEEAREKTGAHIKYRTNFSKRAARFHPAKWVWSLLQRALESASVQLFTRTKVLAIEEKGGIYRVTTQRGVIETQYVVNATEAYTPALHKCLRQLILPKQTQAAFGIDHGQSIKPDITFSSSTSFCGRHGDGLLFGSDETRIPIGEVGRNRPSRFITKYLAAQLRQSFGRFPLRITNEWAGSVGFTPDEYPIVGVMDGKRQYVIAGMSGSGTAVSFNASRCVCRRILGDTEADDYPVEYFGPSRLLDPANHPWPKLDSA